MFREGRVCPLLRFYSVSVPASPRVRMSSVYLFISLLSRNDIRLITVMQIPTFITIINNRRSSQRTKKPRGPKLGYYRAPPVLSPTRRPSRAYFVRICRKPCNLTNIYPFCSKYKSPCNSGGSELWSRCATEFLFIVGSMGPEATKPRAILIPS